MSLNTAKLQTDTLILAIESSCDDTGAAVIRNGHLLSNVVAGQAIHAEYGGVVPELASRAHQEHIIPVVEAALKKAGVKREELTAIACTKGPGLLGALLVGSSFAKGLAMSLNIPLLGINHMQAHILAHFIDDPKPAYPFICLTVSGGHTQLVLVKSSIDFELLGQTRDDAAGEAFDKIGKLLGLPYPAGPVLDKLAHSGDASRFDFPEPQIPGLDFSFSGLKTSVLYFLQRETQKNPAFIENNLNDLCAAVQDRIVSILINKLRKAAKANDIRQLAIAGGVSANSGLRKAMEQLRDKEGYTIFIPDFAYCTDNAGMVAMAGYLRCGLVDFDDQSMVPDPRLPLTAS